MKKFIAVLLTLITVFSCSAFAFAQETTDYSIPVYAKSTQIKNGNINIGYGGTFWHCDTTDRVYADSNFAGKKTFACPCDGCQVADGLSGHKSVEVFYALRCPECRYWNCAYNADDFKEVYANLNYTAPDGSKMNECSVCGYLFLSTDIVKQTETVEIVDEEEKTKIVIEHLFTVVYDATNGDESVIEKMGIKDENNMTKADFESAQKSSKPIAYLLLPFVKLYHLFTLGPGLMLDVILYFAGDLVKDLLG